MDNKTHAIFFVEREYENVTRKEGSNQAIAKAMKTKNEEKYS